MGGSGKEVAKCLLCKKQKFEEENLTKKREAITEDIEDLTEKKSWDKV